MRIIIVTGWGGSGVSTFAAATAAALARDGNRTITFSLTPGLGDAFGVALSTEPTEVTERLHAVESRIRHDREDELRDWIEDLLDWRGIDAILAEDFAALPGMSHVGRLLELEDLLASNNYDVAVLDAAPVPQFLELPPALDAASRWLERLFAPREQTIFEPFLRAFAGDYATTGEDVMERGKELLTRLADLRDVMTDPDITSVRLVTGPGRLAPGRVRDAVTAFSLFSYNTDAIVLNRMLPERDLGAFLADSVSVQTDAHRGVTDAIQNIPLLSADLRPLEPHGLEALYELAAEAYGSHDPADILHRDPSRVVVHENGSYELMLTLPHATRDDLELEQGEDGVIVHMAGHRCVVQLPLEVRSWQAASWSFEAPTLKVTLRP